MPRTRIYDAIRVLEAQGLVEIQHTSPQQFRAVPIDEATETLRDQYESRVDRLESILHATDDIEPDDEKPVQEVWSMVGMQAIANRMEQLIDEAANEIVLVIGHATLLTDELVTHLTDVDDDIDLLVGTVSESLRTQVQQEVPNAEVFVSGLDWLENADESEVVIGRLLLVDRSTILVSTLDRESDEEHAVFGGGFKNGLVIISRRLMSQGLIPTRDPSQRD